MKFSATMKRRSIRAITFVVIGLLLSAVTAWTLAAFNDDRLYELREVVQVDTGACRYNVINSRHFGAELITFKRGTENHVIRQSTIVSMVANADHQWASQERDEVITKLCETDRYAYLEERAFGWPLAMFAFESNRVIPPDNTPMSLPLTELGWGLRLHEPRAVVGDGSIRALPLRPLLPGVVINTVLFAVFAWCAWSLLFLRPRAIIHQWRIKSSRCAYCGYKLIQGQHACPECGSQR